MNCKDCQLALPDLLLDPVVPISAGESSAAAKIQAAALAHIAVCAACAQELAMLKSTFALLDDWQAPEVSPYFDQKLAVRLGEEQLAPAAGWFERLRDHLAFNTGRQFRPAVVSALALALIVGGGSVGISTMPHAHPVEASAAVKDLQILNNNEQALQQMDQLLDDSPADANTAAPPQS